MSQIRDIITVIQDFREHHQADINKLVSNIRGNLAEVQKLKENNERLLNSIFNLQSSLLSAIPVRSVDDAIPPPTETTANKYYIVIKGRAPGVYSHLYVINLSFGWILKTSS